MRHLVLGLGTAQVALTTLLVGFIVWLAAGLPAAAAFVFGAVFAQGIADGHPVSYGDISDPELLSAIHVERAALVVISVDKTATALAAISHLGRTCPQVPVVARARDLETSAQLLNAGAAYAYPETIEASLRLGAAVLRILQVPGEDVDQVIQGVRDRGYRPVLEDEPGGGQHSGLAFARG